MTKKLPWPHITHHSTRLFKEIWGHPIIFSILGMQVILALFTVFNSQFVEDATTSRTPLPMAVLVLIFLVFLIVYYLLTLIQTTLIVSFLQNPQKAWPHSRRHLRELLKNLLLENFRAMAVSTLWTLLLIIPGIFKMVRFYFVSYIVLDDPAYDRGEVDSLERSNELVKGASWPLFGILILSFISTWAIQYWPPVLLAPFMPRVMAELVFYVLAIPFTIFFTTLTFQIYRVRAS